MVSKAQVAARRLLRARCLQFPFHTGWKFLLAGVLRNRTGNEKEDIAITTGNLACISSGRGFIIQTNQVSFTTDYEICQVILIFFTITCEP